MPSIHRASRDAALVELQRLHAAILASRASRGAGPAAGAGPALDAEAPSAEILATQALTRRLQDETETVDEPVVPSRRGWWLALAAAVIVAGAWTAFTLTRPPEVVTEAAPPAPKTASPTAETRASGVASAASSAGATVSATPIEASTAPVKPIQVRLETIRPVWMRVTVDGVRALERELPAGETLSFAGDREVRVRSGDGGGVRASENGVDCGPLGRDGWPVTVPFTLTPAPAAPPPAGLPPAAPRPAEPPPAVPPPGAIPQ